MTDHIRSATRDPAGRLRATLLNAKQEALAFSAVNANESVKQSLDLLIAEINETLHVLAKETPEVKL